jgi:hypothetical protein
MLRRMKHAVLGLAVAGTCFAQTITCRVPDIVIEDSRRYCCDGWYDGGWYDDDWYDDGGSWFDFFFEYWD